MIRCMFAKQNMKQYILLAINKVKECSGRQIVVSDGWPLDFYCMIVKHKQLCVLFLLSLKLQMLRKRRQSNNLRDENVDRRKKYLYWKWSVAY